MQSRRASFIESIANVVVGFSVATIANYYIIPLFGYPVTFSDSFWIGAVFTVISIIRSYLFRRLFNWITYH